MHPNLAYTNSAEVMSYHGLLGWKMVSNVMRVRNDDGQQKTTKPGRMAHPGLWKQQT